MSEETLPDNIKLLTPTLVRQLCDDYQVGPQKNLGQNFMVDSSQVEKIVRLADVNKDNIVLEIGPGLGSLTLGLLKVGAKVISVEIDSKLANYLPKTIDKYANVHKNNLQIIQKDALELQINDLMECFTKLSITSNPPKIKVVANLPYNVGAQILLTLLERFDFIEEGVVLVQAEVARRLTALPGNKVYGIPSVKLNWFANSTLLSTVPRSAFFPVPRVDSQLVKFIRHDNFKKNNREETFTLINIAFSSRRKTIRSLLVSNGYDSDKVREVLDSLQIAPMARGEELSVRQFTEVATKLI